MFNLLHLTRIPTIYLLRNVTQLFSESHDSHRALLNRAELCILWLYHSCISNGDWTILDLKGWRVKASHLSNWRPFWSLGERLVPLFGQILAALLEEVCGEYDFMDMLSFPCKLMRVEVATSSSLLFQRISPDAVSSFWDAGPSFGNGDWICKQGRIPVQWEHFKPNFGVRLLTDEKLGMCSQRLGGRATGRRMCPHDLCSMLFGGNSVARTWLGWEHLQLLVLQEVI